MKLILITMLSLLTLNSFANDYFLELRSGQDVYSKKVTRNDAKVLAGDFDEFNFGLRLGKRFGNNELLIEANLPQDVTVESQNEVANVQSYYLGYRYRFGGFFLGANLGYSEFELEQGPGGITFADNPTTSGLSLGPTLGYHYTFSNDLYLGLDYFYAVTPFEDNGPSSTSVSTIEIEKQQQINITLGFSF